MIVYSIRPRPSMDNGLHIIIQSFYFCQLTCSLKNYQFFREYVREYPQCLSGSAWSHRHGQRTMNMNRYTNARLADIHLNHGIANGNGRVAVGLCGERYPTRWQTNHQTFARGHKNLVEHGSFRSTIDGTTVNSEMDLVARIHRCCYDP
ncbi:hypothetical protein TNCV_1674221 [Trichonephila clavipes]|nr:hypothetical protein TNCV_1674221 [Trichonephila clavipes]